LIANASKAGAVYALIVFICAFVLGTVCVLGGGETAGMVTLH